ncbi:hypothetical protein M440DRAFT_1394430 [Trichoderma longibrachiatum ATCC 18648]|uniref:Ca2+ transporter n=1 Tax=Trichoderma longibrachiatum ATCC 18648 TaxID=983965 RepID=A0A2T4BVD8_TRILO|nr:hypothetical protein M440DRAFT_1394430 [Trichoderma longibrachiatum ATCC 18648]
MDPSQQDNAPPAQRASVSSGMMSPTDNRNPPLSRHSSVADEATQSTDTVRRRPEGYGTIQNMRSSQTLSDHQPGRSSQAGRSTSAAGPERSQSYSRLRKPPLSRRTSATTPHKGEVFSVDDDTHEVEADAAERRAGLSTRRRLPPPSGLARIQSFRSAEDEAEAERNDEASAAEEERDEAEEELPLDEHVDCDSDGDISEAESFTLKDRQQAINQTHPFGIRVWKPALYKKDRSIQKFAQADIHSSPGGRVSSWLLLFNLLWTLFFGWWIACFAAFGAVICLLFSAAPSGREYGRVLWGLAGYLFYPFGKFIRLEKDEAYLEEDQDEGRSISEYEQWQNGDLEYGRLFFGPDRHRSIIGRSRRSIDSEPSETESLLGRGRRGEAGDLHPRLKRRLFGRGEWNIGRIIFFVFFYCLISPSLIIISGICWFLVFWIPMGKVTMLLFDHLRRHPLALSFESHISYARVDDAPDSSILVCTYRAVGSKYWKYTVDGTNIFLINLMVVVVFVIADWLILDQILHVEILLTSPAFLFVAGLLSIIPLAYFIGQAVASISAQSSMGLGAAINAFFATIVEVFLYCVALSQGKGQLVEGSIVGSIFAGILFLPGISMCFGALKRKTQRFNAKSAGVTHAPDVEEDAATAGAATAHAGGHGHDAPNWSRTKSTVILLGATILYAIIAEILVDTVDVVLESFSIDQKFLGLTLFALVPNTTEFLNAISFAMNGNIALSMEIGSAYALQVCLLQIPCLVFFSAVYPNIPAGGDAAMYTFSLLFPQWDLVTVVLCVFLLSYVYGEGKSNYFKGSILMLTYLVVVIGYYFSGYTEAAMGLQRFDVMGADGKYQTFKTIGRSTNGRAFEVI